MEKNNYKNKFNFELSYDNIYNNTNYYNTINHTINNNIIPNYTYNFQRHNLYSKSGINSSSFYKNLYPRGDSIISLYTENNIKPTSHIIKNLKKTLQLTERIKTKILNRNKTYNQKKKLIPTKLNKSSIDDSQNYYKNTKEESITNDDNKYDYNIESIVIDKKEDNKKDIIKLNKIRRDLLDLNMQLRKGNIILEKEINNYKKHFLDNNNIYNNKYYNSIFPQKLDYYKKKYQSSINNNTEILEQIFNIQETNEILEKNINNIYSKDNNIFK